MINSTTVWGDFCLREKSEAAAGDMNRSPLAVMLLAALLH